MPVSRSCADLRINFILQYCPFSNFSTKFFRHTHPKSGFASLSKKVRVSLNCIFWETPIELTFLVSSNNESSDKVNFCPLPLVYVNLLLFLISGFGRGHLHATYTSPYIPVPNFHGFVGLFGFSPPSPII